MAHPDVKSTYQSYVVALQHPYIVKDKLGYYFQSVLLPIYIVTVFWELLFGCFFLVCIE